MRKRMKLSYTQIILVGFLAVIALGTLLLCLPVSSESGRPAPLLTALFTSTSATCVTGLIVVNTGTYWSVFGQVVIITLIQTGGLGVMTILTMFFIFLRHKLSLHEMKLAMQSAGGTEIGFVRSLVKKMLLLTFIFELLGAISFAIQFCPRMGIKKGICYGIFHSISAFCNAGFDLMASFGESSFTGYAANAAVNITLMALIVCGGLGFLVWSDVLHKRLKFKKYMLHTKLVLVSTAALLLIGFVLFYIFEYNHSMKGMPQGERILASLFQSVTPRTAGINTVDQAALSESGNILTVILMFIGASPGSTGGGIKTTTFVIMLLSIICAARKNNNITVFKRRIEPEAVHQSSIIISVYLMAVIASVLTICAIEPFGMKEIIYEVVSAIGTVGLTTGITSSLSSVSRVIIIILMYMGRMGGLAIALSLVKQRAYVPLERPSEKILVG